jgi:hypothetical protein
MAIERFDVFDLVRIDTIDREGYPEFEVEDGFAMVREDELAALETDLERSRVLLNRALEWLSGEIGGLPGDLLESISDDSKYR